MSFLKNSLSFAERFLDDLDKKADGATGTTAHSTSSRNHEPGQPPVFARRSLQAVDGGGGYSSATKPPLPSSASPPLDATSPVRGGTDGLRAVSLSSSSGPSSGVPSSVVEADSGADASRAVHDQGASVTADAVHRRSPGESVDGSLNTLSRSQSNGSVGSSGGGGGGSGADAGTIVALREALQDREVRLMEATAAVDALTRNNKALTADLDDMEAELQKAHKEVDRVKRREESLEKQIKDAYHEVRAVAVMAATVGGSRLLTIVCPILP
jgi:hypothetical protein